MSRNTEFIPFARPSVGEEEERAVLEVLHSGWLTTAGEAKKFEQEFAEKVGSRHALAVNSATAGLHLSLEALGIGPGDSVLTSPYTFTASAEVIRYLGADVLFADIDEETLTIDPEQVERTLHSAVPRRSGPRTSGPRTSGQHQSGRGDSEPEKAGPAALIPVHLGGHPCLMNELSEIADRFDMPIVEDTAHAFPVSYGTRLLGTIGRTGVYSFYATKTITTGEGGMVVTDDEAVAERIRRMRLHGIDRDVWNRYTDRNASWSYDVVAPGYKYNMPDIAAALGRVQLRRADEFLRRRSSIAAMYGEGLADLDFLRLPAAPSAGLVSSGTAGPSAGPKGGHAWHLYILRLVPEKLSIDRDRFIELLRDAGIGASVHYIPLHTMSYYRSAYGFRPEDFPVSLRVFQNAISLPIYPNLNDGEVERVIGEVRRIGKEHYRPTSGRGARR